MHIPQKEFWVNGSLDGQGVVAVFAVVKISKLPFNCSIQIRHVKTISRNDHAKSSATNCWHSCKFANIKIIRSKINRKVAYFWIKSKGGIALHASEGCF